MQFPAGNHVSSSGSCTSDSASCTRALRSDELVPGTRLRIEERVEQGAVGELYRAEHVELARPVALKVLRTAEGPVAVERLRREAALIARIDSPYVVTVLDYGMLPDGRPFYVMPWLGACSLDAAIAAGPLHPERVIGLLRMACKGLAATHAVGHTHRDVKPENLMLVERDGCERLVVVDFGMASPSGTIPEVHGGTPTYMSPEQILGLTIDERADVYALGCVAYEMLTGVAPFVGPTLVSILRQHTDCEPDPPSCRCRATLPHGLETVILRCLEKDPSDRYSSMAELEAALCEVQISSGMRTPWDDLPPPAVDDQRRSEITRGLHDDMAPRPRRRNATLALAAFALALVTAPLVTFDGSASAADPSPTIAEPTPVSVESPLETRSVGEDEEHEEDEAPEVSSAEPRVFLESKR